MRSLRRRTKSFREQEAYRTLGYASWDAFCTKWLDMDAARIRVLTQARECAQFLAARLDGSELPEHGEIGNGRSSQPGRRSDSYNASAEQNESRGRGTSRWYLTARIARDHPEVHDKMKRGAFRSVRQAAIAAGIIQDRTRVSFYADDPERAARNIFKHMCPADIEALVERLCDRLQHFPN